MFLAFDENVSSPARRKHKKKKRKRRKHEQEVSSGGESNAATPGGSETYDQSNSADEASTPTPYGVSVNLKPEEKKILLKFSLKRPVTTEANVPSDTSSKERKEKKHRKSKDREKKRHHSRDKGLSLADSLGRVEPLLPPSNGVPMTAKPVLVTSPSKDAFNRKPLIPLPHSPHIVTDRGGGLDPNPPFDFQGVFDPVKPDFAVFQENFLKDLSPSITVPSNPPNHTSNTSALNYNDFLPADLLSVTNLSPSSTHHHHPRTQGLDDAGVYRGSFMIASHLDYDPKPPNNFLEHISDLQNSSLDMSAHSKPPEPSFSQVTPMGLASYLNSNNPQASVTKSMPVKAAPAKPAARRRAPVSKSQ